jgi:predicted nucleic acid-binding protein
MAFLLDTCALSELVATKPHRTAVENILKLPRPELYLCTITIAEIQSGVDEMKPQPRKDFLRHWLEAHVLTLYGPRTYSLDVAIARTWGRMNATLIRRGLTMHWKDSVIAATALEHSLIVVTRNETDFAPSGVKILNPWK